MSGQVEAYFRDLGWLLARSGEFVAVGCPACGGSSEKVFCFKNGLRYLECGCETVYMSPRPSEKLLSEYYRRSENYAYWNDVVFPASESVRREKIFKPRVDRVLGIVEKYGVDPWVLAEVGAGFGTFCEEMKSRGVFKRVWAIEPTPDLAATCRGKGLDVLEATVEGSDIQKADVVVSFEVIEHLFDPRRFVQACFRGLRRGGVLVLTCPNIKGFETAVLGALSSTIDCEHLNYFHPASLSALLEREGFDILESSTPGELDTDLVRKKLESGEVSDPFLTEILVKKWGQMGESFQRYLSDNGMSSNMWIVARKREKSDSNA